MLEKKLGISTGKGKAILLIAALIASGFGVAAKAVVITSGQTLSVSGEAAPAFASNALLYDSGEVPFNGLDASSDVVFSGDLDSKVYTDPCTGYLDFVYLFSNDSDSQDSILTFSASFFSGYTTDADYITGTGTAPATVERNTQNAGGTLNYSFPDGVAPNSDAAELIIKTNSPNYSLTGLASLQDGGNVTITAPGPVPEPATFAITGFALLALGSRRRSSRR